MIETKPQTAEVKERLTKFAIDRILVNCSFGVFNTLFNFKTMTKGDGFLLQVSAVVPDHDTGKMVLQKGGKHYISSYATKHEVIQTAFKACVAYVEHEAREGFRYKGVDVYRPHWDLDALQELGSSLPHVKR